VFVNRYSAVTVLLILLFCLSCFAPVFFAGKTVSAFDLCYFSNPVYRECKSPDRNRPANKLLVDPVYQMQPWDLLMYGGAIPFPWLWNPYAGFGAPLLGDGQSAPFFPLKWVAYIFGVRRGFGVLCFLKMFLAGLFTLIYLRKIGIGPLGRLLGSIGFMVAISTIVRRDFFSAHSIRL
jgi:hypothetical protein